jgi:hypothetical protein
MRPLGRIDQADSYLGHGIDALYEHYPDLLEYHDDLYRYFDHYFVAHYFQELPDFLRGGSNRAIFNF